MTRRATNESPGYMAACKVAEPLRIKIPVHTVSESNIRCHWAVRRKRVKAQRGAAAAVTRAYKTGSLPTVVQLVRCAPRLLDDDNLRGALKACRDGVADAFGIDDRDPRVKWEYGQRTVSKDSFVTAEFFFGPASAVADLSVVLTPASAGKDER